MTIAEITDAVGQRYKDAKILVDPEVTVFVAEFTRRTITITGEVRAPGVYPIAAPRTLTDTLAMAGGLNDAASRTVSIVHAADPKQIIHVTLNVGAQTPESIEEGRMQILPGRQHLRCPVGCDLSGRRAERVQADTRWSTITG